MGWSGSSDVFNKKMTDSLKGLPVFRIVEDIMIASETEEQHVIDVGKVLTACQDAKISLNTEKVQFCLPKVKFGGFLVQQGNTPQIHP
jgi:hypothetical protein